MESELGISKFKNIGGVTCYMNSILAILQQTPILCDYIISDKYKNNFKDSKIEDKIIFQLHKLFRISMSMDNANLTPSSLRKTCSEIDSTWGELQQQDSCEFLQFLITKIEEEIGQDVKFIPNLKTEGEEMSVLNAIDIIQSRNEYQSFVKKEFSIFKTFFTGLEKTTIECSNCKNEKNKFQIFSIWQLPIPMEKNDKIFELKDCMDKWIENESLDDADRISCDFCGLKTNVNKKCSIYYPPKILIIQLKRFERNLYGNVTKKIDNKINFPINELNIEDYISDGSPYKKNSKYNLIAVNLHVGVTNSGHYYSIVKNRSDNNWYNFNDDCKPEKISLKNDIIDRNAYLLFYLRIN